MNISSLRMTILLVGVILLAIAMFANVNLYMSLASTPVDKGMWATMGLAFDVAKIASLILVGLFWATNKPFRAFLSFLFFLTLTMGSLWTLFGYTSKVTQESERQAAIGSMGYKSAQLSLENSEKRLSELAAVAAIDATALQAKYDSLNQRQQAAEAELNACPRNYLTKCINPAKAKLEAVQRDLAPIASQLGQVNEYRGLEKTKIGAIESSQLALAGGASEDTLHPMFINGAIVLSDIFKINVTPNRLKAYFLAASALVCELLASFLLLSVASLGGHNFHAVSGLQQVSESGAGGIGHQSHATSGIGLEAVATVPK